MGGESIKQAVLNKHNTDQKQLTSDISSKFDTSKKLAQQLTDMEKEVSAKKTELKNLSDSESDLAKTKEDKEATLQQSKSTKESNWTNLFKLLNDEKSCPIVKLESYEREYKKCVIQILKILQDNFIFDTDFVIQNFTNGYNENVCSGNDDPIYFSKKSQNIFEALALFEKEIVGTQTNTKQEIQKIDESIKLLTTKIEETEKAIKQLQQSQSDLSSLNLTYNINICVTDIYELYKELLTTNNKIKTFITKTQSLSCVDKWIELNTKKLDDDSQKSVVESVYRCAWKKVTDDVKDRLSIWKTNKLENGGTKNICQDLYKFVNTLNYKPQSYEYISFAESEVKEFASLCQDAIVHITLEEKQKELTSSQKNNNELNEKNAALEQKSKSMQALIEKHKTLKTSVNQHGQLLSEIEQNQKLYKTITDQLINSQTQQKDIEQKLTVLNQKIDSQKQSVTKISADIQDLEQQITKTDNLKDQTINQIDNFINKLNANICRIAQTDDNQNLTKQKGEIGKDFSDLREVALQTYFGINHPAYTAVHLSENFQKSASKQDILIACWETWNLCQNQMIDNDGVSWVWTAINELGKKYNSSAISANNINEINKEYQKAVIELLCSYCAYLEKVKDDVKTIEFITELKYITFLKPTELKFTISKDKIPEENFYNKKLLIPAQLFMEKIGFIETLKRALNRLVQWFRNDDVDINNLCDAQVKDQNGYTNSLSTRLYNGLKSLTNVLKEAKNDPISLENRRNTKKLTLTDKFKHTIYASKSNAYNIQQQIESQFIKNL